jgi:hypothetical protein
MSSQTRLHANRGKPNRDRDALAARYRAEGWDYLRIANELGYADPSGAYRSVQRGLGRAIREPMAEARHLELNALDDMAREAWAVLRREHFAISQGKVMHHPVTAEPLRDDAPVLAAIDRLLNIQARRAKLLGLDAPVKSRVEVVTIDQIDAEIERLESQLATNGKPV